MTKKTDYTAQEVIALCLTYMNSEHVKFVNKAYEYAANAHKEQMRKSGEEYIIHPIQVAGILAEINMDPVTVATGFLHDVIEDTEYTYDDIKEEFSEEVESSSSKDSRDVSFHSIALSRSRMLRYLTSGAATTPP